MSAKVLHIDAANHKIVDVLLPWFVNGTLESEERGLVQKHLAQCERCRREVEWLQELQAACAVAATPDASPAVHRLREKLTQRPASGFFAAWPRALIAAQLAAILVLGSIVAFEGQRATYRTLGAAESPARAHASLVVVFDPSTTERDLRGLLRDVHAKIVDGPTQANAYLLDVPPDLTDKAMRTLKADRRVVLAQPLAAGSRQ